MGITLLLPLLGYWLIHITFLRQSDIDFYTDLIQKRKIAASLQPGATKQHRKEVRKDIWFSQEDGQRLHYHVLSEGSLLTLTPIQNQFEIVESLHGIKCWMQEKLFYEESPAQQVRYFEATEGEYRYTTQEFVATDVNLSFFRLGGHELPDRGIDLKQAFLQGRAKEVSCFFGGKIPQFQARQFQATMVTQNDRS